MANVTINFHCSSCPKTLPVTTTVTPKNWIVAIWLSDLLQDEAFIKKWTLTDNYVLTCPGCQQEIEDERVAEQQYLDEVRKTREIEWQSDREETAKTINRQRD